MKTEIRLAYSPNLLLRPAIDTSLSFNHTLRIMTSRTGNSSEPRMVIAVYRPNEGLTAELLDCVRDHLPLLRAQGLVTDREPVIMQAEDGSLIEIFEWRSEAAVEQAHNNPAVLALWERFGACCNYTPLAGLEESHHPFAHFRRIEV